LIELDSEYSSVDDIFLPELIYALDLIVQVVGIQEEVE